MAIYVTQTDMSTAAQPYRDTYARIELLNFQFLTVDFLEGVVTNMSVSVNADSDVRRTCNATIAVKDASFNVSAGGKIWLDKYIRVWSGVRDIRSGEINWTNLGIYLINDPNHTYDAATNSITFQGVDLMAKLTGLRNGYAEAYDTVIPIGTNIRAAMISTLAIGGFTRYSIADNPQDVPYEIKVDKSATLYEILKQLRDISAEYEMFFDVEGVFVYQRIPTGAGAPVLIDNTILDKTLITISNQVTFGDVKNTIEVFGKALSPSYYGGDVAPSGSTYTLAAPAISALAEGQTFGFTPSSVVASPKIAVTMSSSTSSAYPLYDSAGNAAVLPSAGVYYVIRYQGDGTFLYMGKQQIHATAQDMNPDSPFYINGTTGVIRQIFTGGEYDNIQLDDLAQQRANYELYLADRINDSITLTCVPIPWLDVNMLLSYTNATAGVDGEYLIKTLQITLDVGGTMTITASRYYLLYPSF